MSKPITNFPKVTGGKYGVKGKCKVCYNRRKAELRGTPEGKARRAEYRARSHVKLAKAKYYTTPKGKRANAENVKRCYIKQRSEHLGNLTLDPSSVDHKYLYIMKWGEMLKVGMSNDPVRRLGEVQLELDDTVKLLAVCSPYAGRTVDNESLAHYDLRAFSTPVTYKSGTVSREWFSAGFDVVLSILEQYGDMELING